MVMRDNFIAFPSGIKSKHGFRVIRGFKTAFRITSVADRTDFEALRLQGGGVRLQHNALLR